MPPVFVFGDIHGHLEPARARLREAGLLGPDDGWRGADATLVFLGDFVDRGPDGAAAVRLARRLEREAAAAGGRALSLLGNHDLLLLAAQRWPEWRSPHGDSFLECWIANGGNPLDATRLDVDDLAWLAGLPAALLAGDALLLHGDCALYLELAGDLTGLELAFRSVAAGSSPARLDEVLGAFSEHGGFAGAEGRRTAERCLAAFGGARVVHGHTPIDKLTGEDPADIRAAHVYHDGLCIDADPGLYRGGPGFVLELAAEPA